MGNNVPNGRITLADHESEADAVILADERWVAHHLDAGKPYTTEEIHRAVYIVTEGGRDFAEVQIPYTEDDPILDLATDDPELRALLEHKADLERRIDELRAVRDQIAQDRYESDLEELLIELALANRAIQARESGGN